MCNFHPHNSGDGARLLYFGPESGILYCCLTRQGLHGLVRRGNGMERQNIWEKGKEEESNDKEEENWNRAKKKGRG